MATHKWNSTTLGGDYPTAIEQHASRSDLHLQENIPPTVIDRFANFGMALQYCLENHECYIVFIGGMWEIQQNNHTAPVLESNTGDTR